MMELFNQSSACERFLRSESGMTRVPVGDALECVAGTDESRFIEVAADKLKGDGRRFGRNRREA